MAKENIEIICAEEGKIYYKDQEAELIPKTRNFYVFRCNIKIRIYSLTIVPSGIAIMFFKYKKDAVTTAKKLNESGINFNLSYEEMVKDEGLTKHLKELLSSIKDDINAGSNFIRAAISVEEFYNTGK